MKKNLLQFTLLFYTSLTAQTQWSQLGADINGEATLDNSGASVSSSSDGLTMAVGAPGNSSGAGHVRIYDWNTTTWVQRGADIDGDSLAGNISFGAAVSLTPDGNTVVVGAPGSVVGPTASTGVVKVYDWNGSAWMQRGLTIAGEGANTSWGDHSGSSVDIDSSGNTIIIGAPYNDGTASESGHARVYHWNGSAWVQRGADIDGQDLYEDAGTCVSISNNGNVIAVGAPFRNLPYTMTGGVNVFYWSGTAWMPQGTDVIGTPDPNGGALIGTSCTLSSTGNTVAIGCVGYTPSGAFNGYIMVHDWNGSAWVQRGAELMGDSVNDQFGASISISADGNSVAGGSIYNAVAGYDAGEAKVFYWNGSAWTQRLNVLYGESPGDNSGSSLCLSGDHNTVIIGAFNNDNSGTSAGHARVFTCRTYDTIPVTVCGSYISPSGNYLWTTSGTYIDTIPNSVSCDSVMTIVLTVHPNSASSISVSACDTYTAPDNQVYTTSGSYIATIPNVSGCDSLITIILTIHSADTSVTSSDPVLTSNATAAAYQWIDCNTNMVVTGATSQSFIPPVNGFYSVAVTQNNCTDTSSCYAVLSLGFTNSGSPGVEVVSTGEPGIFRVVAGSETIRYFEIVNACGQSVNSSNPELNVIDLTGQPAGVYIVMISAGDELFVRKVLNY